MDKGTKTLLFGPGGTGKTTSILTQLDAGLGVFCLFVGEAGAGAATKDPRIHYVDIPTVGIDWRGMATRVKQSRDLGTKALLDLKPLPGKFEQFYKVISTCNDFVCEHCGESFGDVAGWGTDRMLNIDNLSGLSRVARYFISQGHAAMSKPDFYRAQTNLWQFVEVLASDLKCHFTLIAHVDTDRDEMDGSLHHMPATPGLGLALRKQFSPIFTDVVLAQRVGTEFTWSTTQPKYDGLKANNVKWANDLKPSFVQIIKRWRAAEK